MRPQELLPDLPCADLAAPEITGIQFHLGVRLCGPFVVMGLAQMDDAQAGLLRQASGSVSGPERVFLIAEMADHADIKGAYRGTAGAS